MKIRRGRRWAKTTIWACALAAGDVWAQGSLTPPGAPGPTMKTLDQVEARTPIAIAPYTISQSGSYYLTASLTSTGHGVVVTASGVTLDLMGFKLAGDGDPEDCGVLLAGTSNGAIRDVVVRNGVVSSFGYGIRADGGQNCRFEQVSASSNFFDGVLLNCLSNGVCNGNAVVDCAITGSGWHGVDLQGWYGKCNGNAVTHCTITGSGKYAVYLYGDYGQCEGNTVADCTISGNGQGGICLHGSDGECDGNTVADCTISRNGWAGGVVLNGSDGECNGNTVTHCTISGNGSSGVHLDGSGAGQCNGNAIADCTISRSGSAGISLGFSCDGNTIAHCTVRKNTTYGIYLFGPAGNRLEDNHVSGQTGNPTYGICCTNTAKNLILRNTCAGQTNNFIMSTNDTYGPIVTSAGALAVTGAAAHAWANFSR